MIKDISINGNIHSFVLRSGYGGRRRLCMFSAMQAAFILAWGTKENILILFELFLYSEYVYWHLASVIFRLVFIMHLLHLLFSAWNLFLLLHLVKATNCTNNYYTFFLNITIQQITLSYDTILLILFIEEDT